MQGERNRCFVCGATLAFSVADLLIADAGPPLAAQCVACLDRQLLGHSPMLFRSPAEPPGALFPLGQLTVTREAAGALAEAGLDAAHLLARHARLHGSGKIQSWHRTARGRLLCATTEPGPDGPATAISLRRAG